MKIRIFIFLFLFSVIKSISQSSILGKITSSNGVPLIGASVYFNNTTVGTISDDQGKFGLKIKDGNYILVVSFLGYKTKQLTIDTTKQIDFLTIQLQEESNILDEVEITKTKYDDDWRYNLSKFKRAFLGRTKLASQCKILNEKDLHFDFNFKTNTLTAFARKPLKIKHYGLGYLISYDLVNFKLQKNRLFFSGYARYSNLRKSIRKKWKRNRRTAYNGSQMHFFRSLMLKKAKEDGFNINQFKRVLNPDRPTEKQIKIARELIRLNGGRLNFSKDVSKPITALDSAIVVVRKSRLPKYQDILYKKDVPYSDIISFKGKTPILDFENYLMVIYTKETEEDNYLIGMFGKKKRQSGVQTSNIVLLNGKAVLDKSGITANPDALFNSGYWAFESFANMLPLDYIPLKK